jgi:hypothetical protein
MRALSHATLNTLTPRFGSPGNAALFVGADLRNDYFYFPMSQCAVVQSERKQTLLTQHEEDTRGAALYDFAQELYELTTRGVVLHIA